MKGKHPGKTRGRYLREQESRQVVKDPGREHSWGTQTSCPSTKGETRLLLPSNGAVFTVFTRGEKTFLLFCGIKNLITEKYR